MRNSRLHRTLTIALTTLLACCPQLPTQAQDERPNVLLMMADDLGYHDLSCYGSTRQRTPHIDALARQGVRLTSFYAGASVCSPSRMALLSGAYPARLGWRGGVLGYGMHRSTGLARDVFTIAELFQSAGYRTAMAGKWHVGVKDLLPMHQGFDSSFYIAASNNMSRDMFRDGKLVQKQWDNRRLSEAFTLEVIRLIQEESDQPFFIYVPFTAPHFPAEAHSEWEGKSQNAAYGDVVEELDFRVGQILDALQAASLAEKTIVVFTSDNGPEGLQREFASALPLSGEKWMSREGGTRVPCIFRYPDVIPPNKTNDAIMGAIDLLPTLAEACGIPIALPDNTQKIDGLDLWAGLTGESSAHGRKEFLYWHGKGPATALRQDEWKLYFGGGKGDPDVSESPALFNLQDDISETKDLSLENPERVQAMLRRAEELLTEIDENQIPIGDWTVDDGPEAQSTAEMELGKWLRQR